MDGPFFQPKWRGWQKWSITGQKEEFKLTDYDLDYRMLRIWDPTHSILYNII